MFPLSRAVDAFPSPCFVFNGIHTFHYEIGLIIDPIGSPTYPLEQLHFVVLKEGLSGYTKVGNDIFDSKIDKHFLIA